MKCNYITLKERLLIIMSAEYIGNGYSSVSGLGCGAQAPCPLAVCPVDGGCAANACGTAGCVANACLADGCVVAGCLVNACPLNGCLADGCLLNFLPTPGPLNDGGTTE